MGLLKFLISIPNFAEFAPCSPMQHLGFVIDLVNISLFEQKYIGRILKNFDHFLEVLN